MGLADNADFPPAGHQPGDDVRSHMGLAGPGRTLHRDIGMIQGTDGLRDRVNEPVRTFTGGGQPRPCGKARRNPADQIQGRMVRKSGRAAAATPR